MDEHSASDQHLRGEVALLAARSGLTLSADEVTKLTSTVVQDRAGLELLRTAIQPEEEPAHTFAKQVGRSRS